MRGLSVTGLGRVGLFTFGVIALLAIGALALAMLTGADAQPAKRAIQPTGAEEATPEPVAETASKTERTIKEPTTVEDEASASASASAPADAMMSLSVPAMGISDIPVVEGTSEASL